MSLASWKVLVLLDLRELFIEPKNVKVTYPQYISHIYIGWGSFHSIIKVILVKYNTPEMNEKLFYYNAAYLFESIYLCNKKQAKNN